jgi:hypothetical protein
MFATDKGVPYRARPLTYATGSSTNLDLSFLQSPMNRMRAPVVRELAFHFEGSISGTTGGFDDKDACQLFSKIVIRDRGGIIHDLPGKLIRARQILELGERGSSDADSGADVASGATNAAYSFILRVPFDVENGHVGSDTALPLLHLVEGGNIEVGFTTPAQSVVNSGTVTTYALVHDEKYRELKARMVAQNFAVTISEDDYAIGGHVRWLVLLSNPTAQGYSDWTTATYPTIDVPELELSNQSITFLRSEYKRIRIDRSADDPITSGGPDGVPLIWASRGQRIDKMPNLPSVRIRLTAAPPTSAQLLQNFIIDRFPPLAAEWMGYASIDGFMAAARERGAVKLGNGGPVKATDLPPELSRRLPMVLA